MYHIKRIIFLIEVIVLTASCNNSTQHQNPVTATKNNTAIEEESPEQTCFDMVISLIDSNETKAVIKSRRAQVFGKSKQTVLDSGVKVQFLDSYGKPTGYLTSFKLRIDDATKDMFATGNVVVISDSASTKLETEELRWNQLTRKIYSDINIKLTSPDEIIYGIGFESNENLSNYKIYRVTGVKQYNPK